MRYSTRSTLNDYLHTLASAVALGVFLVGAGFFLSAWSDSQNVRRVVIVAGAR